MKNITLYEEIEKLQNDFAILRRTNADLLTKEKLRVSVIDLQIEVLHQCALVDRKDRCRSIQCESGR